MSPASTSKAGTEEAELKEHSHHWHLERHARYVEKGTCLCTAVKFFPNDFCKEALEEAEKFNKKFGKAGDITFHIKELEKQRSEIVKIIETTETPVPPKPHFDSIAGGARLLHKYYIDNGPAIIADFDKLGEKPMLEKWGISDSGWRTLRVTLMPDRFQKPVWRKSGKTAPVNKPKTIVPEEAPLKPVIIKETPREKEPEVISSPIVGHALPPFPVFGNDWPESTQIEWIKTYKELASK
jgi:hypothetical protein